MKKLFLLALGYGFVMHSIDQDNIAYSDVAWNKEFECLFNRFDLPGCYKIQAERLNYLTSEQYVSRQYDEIKKEENPETFIARRAFMLELCRLQKAYHQTWAFSKKRKELKAKIADLSYQMGLTPDSQTFRVMLLVLDTRKNDFLARQDKFLANFIAYHHIQKQYDFGKRVCDAIDAFA